MEQFWTTVREWFVQNGASLTGTLVILLAGWIAAKFVRRMARQAFAKGQIDGTVVSFVSSICYFGIIVLVVIAALSHLGVPTASFIAILGAAGLAISLALQESLGNFASGLLMVLLKPFKAGDFVEGAGVQGIVKSIGIFSMELISLDNKKIIVPNSKMMNGNIINYTAENLRRLEIVINVSYRDDLDKVKKILEGILAGDERILKDPVPAIGVMELAENGVKLAVRPWVKTVDYGDVLQATLENIKRRFDAEGIHFPFQQREVYVHPTG